MKFQRMLSSGKWTDEDRIDYFVAKAVEAEKWLAPNQNRQPRSADEIKAALAKGEVITYGGDWYARLRDADALQPAPKRQPDYPNGRRLDCGHIVYFQSEVMSASLGSSCEACYDRMSS